MNIRKYLPLAVVFVLWGGAVAFTLYIAGQASTACAVGPTTSPAPACGYGLEWFAWLLFLAVLIIGARMFVKMAKKMGISFD